MESITVGEHTFIIVERIEAPYFIWNIGNNMPEGYLPLCRKAAIQPFDGACCIDQGSLQAIKCEGAQQILAAASYGLNNFEDMVKYMQKNSDSTSRYIQKAVQAIKTALPYIQKLQKSE